MVQRSLRCFKSIFMATLLLNCVIWQTQSYTIKDFHSIWPWEYKAEGLYSDISIGVTEPTDSTGTKIFSGLVVLAIGDFDDNKRSDLVVTNDDHNLIAVYLYNEDDMDFTEVNTIELSGCEVQGATAISAPPFKLAVICGEHDDYDYIKLLEGVTSSKGVLTTDLSSFLLEKGSQPVFIDMNSDSYADIVYNSNSASGSDEQTRVLLYNPSEKSYGTSTSGFLDTYVFENDVVGCPEITETFKLSSPHFTSVSDVNADCISDLYMTVTDSNSDVHGLMFVAVRVRNGNQESLKYCLTQDENLTSLGFTSPVFADFDDDSAIDKAFYDTNNNGIAVYYNVRGAKDEDDDSLCRSIPTINGNSPSGYFTDYDIFSSDFGLTTSGFYDVVGLYTHDSTPFIPGQLRVTDIDSDGKPDIIATVEDSSGNSQTKIFKNEDCSGSGCKIRSFDSSNDYDKISDYTNTMYGFLMDFDDNGRPDIVLVQKDDNDVSKLVSFYNNYDKDSYYISASIHTSGSEDYGQRVMGVNCRGIYTSLNDHRYTFTSQQITRASYAALEEGIATYEIGRSNNYIEDFTVSYPEQKTTSAGSDYALSPRSRTWTPIIPNSHLVIDIHDLSDWEITLLVNPTDSFLLVGVIVVLILIGTGFLIIWMHMKEKKEDEKERNPQMDFF